MVWSAQPVASLSADIMHANVIRLNLDHLMGTWIAPSCGQVLNRSLLCECTELCKWLHAVQIALVHQEMYIFPACINHNTVLNWLLNVEILLKNKRNVPKQSSIHGEAKIQTIVKHCRSFWLKNCSCFITPIVTNYSCSIFEWLMHDCWHTN